MVELGRHGRNRTNVWDYASVNSMRGSRREDLALHPTVKPTGLVADAIQDVTRRGDLVLNFFWAPERRFWQPSGPGGASAGLTSIRPMSMWRSNAGRRGQASSRVLREKVVTLKSELRSPVLVRHRTNPGWFPKGRSGNLKGRPRKPSRASGSPLLRYWWKRPSPWPGAAPARSRLRKRFSSGPIRSARRQAHGHARGLEMDHEA